MLRRWSGAGKDKTEMKQGVGERKYEIDSLCYPIRLAHGYWKQTGDTKPFDTAWQKAMTLVVQTLRVQQRKHGEGPYQFQREAFNPTDTLPGQGLGNPVKPVGLIASGFRPSDDACIYPFLVPSNCVCGDFAPATGGDELRDFCMTMRWQTMRRHSQQKWKQRSSSMQWCRLKAERSGPMRSMASADVC